MDTSLIIRNLSDKVTVQDIKAIMDVISPIQSIKTLKNLQCVLIGFYDHKAAEQAFYMMNGRPIHNQIISIDWNYANTSIIVDPLDSSITESNLFKAFESLGAIDACVMNENDHIYGIVTFSTKIDALQAMDQMNGKHLFSNPVHLTLQEESEEDDKSTIGSRRSSSSAQSDSAISGISYEDIFAQTPLYHTVIYIKNLPKQTTRHEIISLLQHHGIVHNHEIIMKKRMAIIT
ncbi:hypothetical protein BCV71DRAFT_173067 [Rhizopus microsporus]|nr:hypothetical protein BCV71DRAFT_173067 [Rhizopus microsporus]